MAVTKAHRGVYGSVVLERGYCTSCQGFAFIIDGLLQCCNKPTDLKPRQIKRMTDAAIGRRGLSRAFKEQLLEAQDHRCFYCNRMFGSYVWRDGRAIELRTEYDHVTPYIYSYNNNFDNFVAACQVCNRIKSAYVFDTVEEARIALQAKREEKGYRNVPPLR